MALLDPNRGRGGGEERRTDHRLGVLGGAWYLVLVGWRGLPNSTHSQLAGGVLTATSARCTWAVRFRRYSTSAEPHALCGTVPRIQYIRSTSRRYHPVLRDLNLGPHYATPDSPDSTNGTLPSIPSAHLT